MNAPGHSAEGGPRVYLETFGCQMNELDSDLVRGQLSAMGYRFSPDPHAAEVLLYNTCSVRQHAEDKVLSRVGLAGQRKRRGERLVLGVIGCLAEREGAALMSRYPQIDLLCGPGELDLLPQLLDNALKTGAVERADNVALAGNRSRRWATLAAAEDNLELLDLSRSFDPDRAAGRGAPPGSAYVRITRGCNKFCTYCVVPYTRGAEVHRPPDHIVDECRRLADAGVVEVTLLGQTVNHYVYTHGTALTASGAPAAQTGPGSPRPRGRGAAPGRRVTTFAGLLARIHDEVPAIRRLRFVTSFPRDFGDDVLEVMAACPRICRYLHLPVQSGSDRVLRLMNRGYTTSQYLELVDRARARLDDVALASDVIVGFPTETDEDFERTLELMRRARFKNCFVFKYSPRPGTAAFERLPDDVERDVKRRRNNDALRVQAGIGAAVHAEYVGRTVEVFVEKEAPHSARNGDARVELRWERGAGRAPKAQLSGRTGGDLITVFDLPDGRAPGELLGRIVEVEVTGSGPLILHGRLRAGTHGAGGRLTWLPTRGGLVSRRQIDLV